MLHVLTPTDGRPEAFSLLERWLGAQEWPDGFRWIVGTRDAAHYTFELNQVVVERPDTRGLHPLTSNLLACFEALDLRPGDLALVCEDDDYYAPGYFSRTAALADGVPLAGQSHARYYHVAARRYHQYVNDRYASLAQTAFRSDVAPILRELCLRGKPYLDRALWSEWTGSRRLSPSDTHVGMKGMPGTRGIGVGHRPTFGQADRGGRVFREWSIPDEYARYAWTKSAHQPEA